MASEYTIVQYLPNPITGERVNVGVIVLGEDRAYCRFLKNWRRVKQFGAEDLGFLRAFARDTSNACSPQQSFEHVPETAKLDRAIVARMIEEWANSLQLTPLRGSLLEAKDLLGQLASRFLVEPQTVTRGYLDRKHAASMAIRSVSEVVSEKSHGMKTDLVHTRYPVRGEFSSHKFDVAVANGVPFFLAHGLSFETSEKEREEAVQLALWGFRDVREEDAELPMGVVLVPPKKQTTAYKDILQQFKRLNVSVIEGKSVDDVRPGIAKIIPEEKIAA